MADPSRYSFSGIQTTFPAAFVAHVELNRPKSFNSFSPDVFHNLAHVFDRLSEDENVRVIILSGVGKHFSSGLDVKSASSSGPVGNADPNEDIARRTWKVRRHMKEYQNGISAVERCEKPVIVCAHGVAYGAAIDLILAADIRYASSDVRFSIKEVDIGIAADVGTLSRLPKVGVSYSWAKEVVYTAREFGAVESERVGFVSNVYQSKQDLLKAGLELANAIASKSPVAVQSSKHLFDISRDRSVAHSLEYTAAWNSPMVQSEDVKKAMMNGLKKTKSTFEKL